MLSYKSILNENINEATESEQLELLKKILLGCYKEIDEVCRKHDIKLIAAGGTALGLVRHNGFIPWDDDLDLGMSRKDYNRFLKIFENELSDRYIISVPQKPYKANNRFMQLYRKNTYLEKSFYEIKSEKKMVSVDIFPLDYVPDNKFICYFKGIYCNTLMAIASSVQLREEATDEIIKIMKSSFKGKVLYLIHEILGFVFSYRNSNEWFYKIDKCVQSKKKTNKVAYTVGRKHFFGEIFESRVFFPLKKGRFEGIEMYIPNEIEKYLRGLYGSDYMQLPPVEKRESHNIKRIEILEGK